MYKSQKQVQGKDADAAVQMRGNKTLDASAGCKCGQVRMHMQIEEGHSYNVLCHATWKSPTMRNVQSIGRQGPPIGF